MENIENITDNDKVYAIVLRKEFNLAGANFFTPAEFSQQLGMLVHEKGKIVERHKHKLVKREILRTQEVLVLLDGKIKVDLFDDDGRILKTVVLNSGDSILLAQGGHKVEVMENSKIIEVKQGPYAGFDEKVYF